MGPGHCGSPGGGEPAEGAGTCRRARREGVRAEPSLAAPGFKASGSETAGVPAGNCGVGRAQGALTRGRGAGSGGRGRRVAGGESSGESGGGAAGGGHGGREEAITVALGSGGSEASSEPRPGFHFGW